MRSEGWIGWIDRAVGSKDGGEVEFARENRGDGAVGFSVRSGVGDGRSLTLQVIKRRRRDKQGVRRTGQSVMSLYRKIPRSNSRRGTRGKEGQKSPKSEGLVCQSRGLQ